jgi:DNA-binding LacI/PurR family transcriptional regulator
VPDRSAGRSRRRPAIGFTLQWGADNDYIGPMWFSALDRARELGVDLICFGGRHGGMLGEEGFNSAALRQASAANLDGMVVVSCSLDAIRQLDGFGRLPMATTGGTLKEFPGVASDNFGGIRSAMVHLIADHGHRRIAFIKGPGYDTGDAAERFRGYTATLKEYGLAEDPLLIVPGTYSIDSGREAAKLLLERGAKFDAIVSANDNMALGAMQVLKESGIRVPYDVAVTGFDDSLAAPYMTPPLTTVRQPQRAMGRRVVELVHAQIKGEAVPPQETLPNELVVRQSCGCFSEDVTQAGERAGKGLSPRRSGLARELERAAEGRAESLEAGWAERLASAFSSNLRDPGSKAFLASIDEAARKIAERDAAVSALNAPLSALRRAVLPTLMGGSRERAESLFQQARVFLGDAALRQQAQKRADADSQNALLREIGDTLITTFDLAGLMDIVARDLPRLGIGSCYLALNEGQGDPSERSRLVLAYKDGKRVELEAGGRSFATADLLPPELRLDRQHGILSMPLYFGAQTLGYAVFEVGPRNGAIYEVLRSQLSSALKGALLLGQIQEHSKVLASGIENQTTSLEAMTANIDIINSNMEAQSSAVVEEAGSIEEMARNISQISKMANQVQDVSADLSQVARENMSDIQDSIALIQAIHKDSRQILELLDMIKAVAEQTNILALNAAIQAAHAGEEGKGFGVVAAEIQRLADDTNDSISGIETAVDTIVKNIEESTRIVVKTGDGLGRIVASSASNSDISRQLNSALTEQDAGVKEVLQATQELVSITEQVKNAVNEQKRATEGLNDMLGRLRELSGASD